MARLYYNKQENNVCHRNTGKMIYHRGEPERACIAASPPDDKSFTSIMTTHIHSSPAIKPDEFTHTKTQICRQRCKMVAA